MNVNTLADGEPRNNFFERAVTWNENGVLNGASHITLGGHYAYITTPKGLVFVDINNPLKPRHITTLPLQDARATAVQFRYLFATTAKGLEVIDITHPAKPEHTGAVVAMADAPRVYLARTYAYVAAKKQGLVIVDIERPRKPVVYQQFTADGQLNDAHDVVVGSIYRSPGETYIAGAATLFTGISEGTLFLQDATRTYAGALEYDVAGWDVDSGVDLDGDGFSDLLVGASGADRDDDADVGSVHLFYGPLVSP